MDPGKVREAFGRAAFKAASGKGRPKREMAAILRDDIPTFMEAPAATTATEFEGAGAVVLGIPYEGVKIYDPMTYLPPLASPPPDGPIYFCSGADQGPAAIRPWARRERQE